MCKLTTGGGRGIEWRARDSHVNEQLQCHDATSMESSRHAEREKSSATPSGLADLRRKRQRQLRMPVPRARANAAMSQQAIRGLHIAAKRESGAEQSRAEKRRVMRLRRACGCGESCELRRRIVRILKGTRLV